MGYDIYRPDETHPNAVTALHQGLSLQRVLKDAKSVKHESIVTFHNLRYDVYSQLANFDQTSGIKVCVVCQVFCCVFSSKRVRVSGHLYRALLWDEPTARIAQVWPMIARGSYSFTCHPLTNHTCL